MTDTKINLLYVDDEHLNLLAFQANFRRDYNVYTAGSASVGLDVLEKEDIQVVISDHRMPEMTGVEFLDKVQEKHPEVIRIILTGFADVSSVIDAINRGKVYSYVTKPWNEEELRHTIESANMAHNLMVHNKELQEKYEELMSFIPFPVLLMDTKARVVDTNDAAVEQFGYSQQEMITHDYAPFFSEENTLQNILERIKRDGKLTNFPVQIRKKDSSVIECKLHSTPIGRNDRYASTYQLVFVPGEN